MLGVDNFPGCSYPKGWIMMLPNKSEVPARILQDLNLDDGIFNHPVVILSKRTDRGKVSVLIITSFNGTPIKTRHNDPRRRERYIPIHPADHPDTTCTLILANGKRMKKNSYVGVHDIHEVPLEILRHFWEDGHRHLQEHSYRILVSELWKRNVVELNGRGIFDGHNTPERERVRQPSSTERSVSSLSLDRDGHLHRLGGDIRSIGSPRSTPSSSYGTLVQGSRAAVKPRGEAATTPSNARTYNHQPRTYPGYSHMPSQLDTMPVQQNRLPTYRRTNDMPGNGTAMGTCFAGAFVTMLILGAVWYNIPKGYL